MRGNTQVKVKPFGVASGDDNVTELRKLFEDSIVLGSESRMYAVRVSFYINNKEPVSGHTSVKNLRNDWSFTSSPAW